ncbi:MAG: hypothetical protein ACE5O2_00780 [Armatimonadota bacterium]
MSHHTHRCLFERLAIAAVAAHSLILGALMLLTPGRLLRIVGWEPPDDLFFASQSGAFLLILGAAYLGALWHRPYVWILIGSKLGACVFLYAHGLFLGAPFSVMLLGAEDGCMGLLVWAAVMLSDRAAARARIGQAPTDDHTDGNGDLT